MKKILTFCIMACMLFGCAYAQGPDADQVTAWAEALLGHEAVAAGLPEHRWKIDERDGHWEAIAGDDEGNTLFMCAFLPSGQPIYLCNMFAGDTDCFVSEQPKYTRGSAEQLELTEYALKAAQSLTPAEPDTLKALELEAESDRNGESIYLNHHEAGTPGWQARRWVRLQVEPEIRVTHFVDGRYFSGDDVDRLEPGLG